MTSRRDPRSPACRPTGAAGWRRRSSRSPRSRRSSASTAARRRSSSSAPSSCGSSDSHSLIRRIVHGGGDRHGRRHPPRRGLHRHHPAAGPREQRHRDDERPGRLRRARLARAQGRVQARARTTTAPSRTTRPSSPRTCAARIRRARALEQRHRRGRALGRGLRRQATPTRPSPSLRFANGLGPGAADLGHRALRPARRADDPGLRPAAAVHPRGGHRRLPRARRAPRPAGRLQLRRRRGPGALARSAGLLGKVLAPVLPPWGTGWRLGALARAGVARIPPELLKLSCASAAAWTTAG